MAGTRQETVLHRQSGAALCVAWSPDGKTLACGGQEKTAAGGSIGLVELWDPAKKTGVVWRGHDGHVTGVAFAPGGAAPGDAVLASASVDHNVPLWDAKRPVLVKL